MNRINYTFFEEFKRLDKLCGDLYQVQYGVTQYIDDMKAVPPNRWYGIPNWKTDLDKLIGLRHARNHLAHTEGAFYEVACSEQDIEWIEAFYRRILQQSDPLALLHQKMRESERAVKRTGSPKTSAEAVPRPAMVYMKYDFLDTPREKKPAPAYRQREEHNSNTLYEKRSGSTYRQMEGRTPPKKTRSGGWIWVIAAVLALLAMVAYRIFF